MSETTEKNTKRVATAYLPSGKELKFVFDEYDNGPNDICFSLEGKQIAYIPKDIPMMFHNLQDEIESQKRYDEMCDKLHDVGFGTMGVQKPASTVTSVPQPNGTTKGIEVFYKNHLGYHSSEKLIYPNDIDETFDSTNEYIKTRLIAKLSKNGIMQGPHIAGTTIVSWKFI